MYLSIFCRKLCISTIIYPSMLMFMYQFSRYTLIYNIFFILANPFIYDPLGKYYTGTINKTETFTKCQSWNTTVIKIFFKLKGSQFADGIIPGAVCRNPDISAKNKSSPWCIINVNSLQEESCFLTESCKSLLLVHQVLQYTPSVSTLILSGRTYSSQNVGLTPEKCPTNLRVNTL